MKAAVYEKFKQPLMIQNLPKPHPTENGVVLQVKATGICRSDWHGWMGNDPDIRLPHVPGHEFSGVVEEVGKNVKGWNKGDRVTLPFVCACGHCAQCLSGNHQICDRQFQPGFTHWGAFAEYVMVDNADVNLVRLPDEMDFVTASGLGCRFITAYRAIVEQAKVSAGQWVSVHGCGGVGLSAIMIANASGANVVAVDINDEVLEFSKLMGAVETVNVNKIGNTAGAIKEITNGGAHASIDALGNPDTCFNSISGLRKRGKHIQVGLMEAEHRQVLIPMDQVVAKELEILGSHGMQAYKYPEIFEMIKSGKLEPGKLIKKRISLEESLDELVNMNNFGGIGVTVIDKF